MKPLNNLHSILNIGLLFLLFGIAFNGIRPANKIERWSTCYNTDDHSIHFQRLLRRSRDDKTCIGTTLFKMPQGWKLIENSRSSSLFGELRPGTKKSIMLDGGRRILAAQWEKPNKNNLITILEPRLNKSSVQRHCVIANNGQAFSVRYDRGTGKLGILVKNKRNKPTWKSCAI